MSVVTLSLSTHTISPMMTHSQEEATAVSLLTTIHNTYQTAPEEALACLKQIKHSIIGHDLAKHLYVEHNLIQVLVRILELEHVLKELKLEAGTCIGSLSYGMTRCRSSCRSMVAYLPQLYRRRFLCKEVTPGRCPCALNECSRFVRFTPEVGSNLSPNP